MENVLKNIGLRLHLKESNVLMKGLPLDGKDLLSKYVIYHELFTDPVKTDSYH